MESSEDGDKTARLLRKPDPVVCTYVLERKSGHSPSFSNRGIKYCRTICEWDGLSVLVLV